MILFASQKNAQIEIDNNNAEQERLRGTLVYYGQTIQVIIRLYIFSSFLIKFVIAATLIQWKVCGCKAC